MRQIIFPPKSTYETLDLTFSFLSDLASGETISGASSTATVYSGTDATPSSLIDGAAQVGSQSVVQTIIGGVAGVTYEISCFALTSAGQSLQISGYLTVLPQPA